MSEKPRPKYFSRSNLIWLSVELVVVWFLLSPVVARPLYDHILFPTWIRMQSSAPPSTGITPERITLAGPHGTHLDALFYAVKNAKRTVLVSHGNGGTLWDRQMLVNTLRKSNASVFIYDYEGYGESTGSPSISNLCADGETAYDFLTKTRGIPCDQIVLLGESLGCGITCRIAETRCCRSIVLISPFRSLITLAKAKLPWLNLYPDSWFKEYDLSNESRLSSWKQPLLLIHGTQDTTIPPRESSDIARLNTHAKLVMIQDRGHNDLFVETPSALVNNLKQFLAD